jgi:hypothetical protein
MKSYPFGPSTPERARRRNPSDLEGAKLIAAIRAGKMAGADLQYADLTGANLSGVNLTGTDLTGANLYKANLTRAILRGVNLAEADLTDANLSGADLTGANLTDTDLTDTILEGVVHSNVRGTALPPAKPAKLAPAPKPAPPPLAPAGGGWVVVEHDKNFYSPVMTRAAADVLAAQRRSQIGPKWRPRDARDDAYWEEEAKAMRASAVIEVLPAAEGLQRQLNQLMVPGGYVDDLKLVDPAALLAVTRALSRALDDQMRASAIWHEGPDYFGARIRRPASASRGYGDQVECIFRVASSAYTQLMEKWTHAVELAVAPYANSIQKIEFEQYENVDRGTTQVRTQIIMKD